VSDEQDECFEFAGRFVLYSMSMTPNRRSWTNRRERPPKPLPNPGASDIKELAEEPDCTNGRRWWRDPSEGRASGPKPTGVNVEEIQWKMT